LQIVQVAVKSPIMMIASAVGTLEDRPVASCWSASVRAA
jgi:hypothetical protein